MKGTEKYVDALGRVVLPAKYRSKLGLKCKSKVCISLEDSAILITPTDKICALCGCAKEINEELRMCTLCIKRVKEFNLQKK